MPDMITPQQFIDRTGRTLTSTQSTQLDALIEDASALVADIVGDTDVTDSWDADQAGTVPAAVVPVVVAMVRRGLDNPHGFTQESAEGYSYSGASGRGVFATRQETRTIRKAAGSGSIGELNLTSHMTGRRSVAWLDGAL